VAVARRLGSLVATNWWTWRTVRRRGVSVVHCNDPAPFWHVALGARLAGVPLVLNLRDTKSREEGLDIAKYRRRFRWSTRVLVLSRQMKEFYAQACARRQAPSAGRKRQPAIEYIYSIVDFSRMRPLDLARRADLRTRLGIKPDTFAVGFIATFNEKKNQLGYLREAVLGLAASCPSAHTYFVGDFDPQRDPYARECQTLVAHRQLESSVTFTSYAPKVEEWYQACDVIVVPTRKEGLARCMIEALACGTPVVSFDVASAREILEEHQCGRVVTQGDYAGLCRAITELAVSRETRRNYAANGAAVARELFCAESCLEKYRRLILNLQEESVSLR
jgi:glycosyltransferase involved in cell wall biosynthesis